MQRPFSRTGYDLLREQAARAPDRPAVIAEGGTMRLARWQKQLRMLPARCARMGARADDRFLISIPLFWFYGAVNALIAAARRRIFSAPRTPGLGGDLQHLWPDG